MKIKSLNIIPTTCIQIAKTLRKKKLKKKIYFIPQSKKKNKVVIKI